MCKGFPLHRIIRVEAEADFLARENNTNQHDSAVATLVDRSCQTVVRDASMTPVDVIVDCLVDPARPSAMSRLTRAWYAAVSQRLTVDGIFCQRVRQTRISADTIRVVLGSISCEFEHTCLIQLVSGELAILGTNSKTPLFDGQTLARMERKQVRRPLAVE